MDIKEATKTITDLCRVIDQLHTRFAERAYPLALPESGWQAIGRALAKPRWLFQANADFTESQLTEATPERDNDHDTDGKPYSFKHVFEAEDWDQAKLQIARLRFGPDAR